MTKSVGWESLICTFFYPVCVRVIGAYFSALGFAEHKTNINGVFFKKDDLYVEVSYIPETSPNYSLSLVVGIGDGKYDGLGKASGVPAWNVLPKGTEVRKYSLWKFSDEQELEIVINRVKVEIIEPYLKPLWQDRVALENAINAFKSIVP